MIKSTITHETKKENKELPKLMVGKNTGTIYLVVSRDNWSGELTGVVLRQGNDSSVKVGNSYKYDAFLFEDFNGTITLTNGE